MYQLTTITIQIHALSRSKKLLNTTICDMSQKKSDSPKSLVNNPSQYYDSDDTKKHDIDLCKNSAVTNYPDFTVINTTSNHDKIDRYDDNLICVHNHRAFSVYGIVRYLSLVFDNIVLYSLIPISLSIY